MDINTNVIIPIMPTAVVNILFFSSLEILFPLEKITIITAIMGTIIIVIPCAKMMSSKGSDPNMWAIMAPIKITNIIMARTLIFRRLLMPNKVSAKITPPIVALPIIEEKEAAKKPIMKT